jgi:hypothetical protein
LPSTCKLGLFVTLPAISVTLPFYFMSTAFNLILRAGVHPFFSLSLSNLGPVHPHVEVSFLHPERVHHYRQYQTLDFGN